jgi:hypothetical protein
MTKTSDHVLSGLLITVLCVPLSFLATLALGPLWVWMQLMLGIETIGKSGVTGWCTVLVYVLLTNLSHTLYWKLPGWILEHQRVRELRRQDRALR